MAEDSTTVFENQKSRRYLIFAALIGAAATLIAVVLKVRLESLEKPQPPPGVQITGRISNAQTDDPVRKAAVSLEASGIPQHTESDSKGIFTASVAAGYTAVRVRVAAHGFKPYDQLLPRDLDNQLISVALEPETRAKSIQTESRHNAASPRARPAKVSMASMLNASLPVVAGDGGPWAVILFGDQERREEVTSAIRSALSESGHDTVSLFRKVADEQRLASDVFRGSSDILHELDAGRYCSRILIGRLSVVRIGVTEGITFGRATLSVHVVSPVGELLKTLEFSEKGGGEDDITAKRRAVDELIEALPRQLPNKID